jgi:hypothetical protein
MNGQRGWRVQVLGMGNGACQLSSAWARREFLWFGLTVGFEGLWDNHRLKSCQQSQMKSNPAEARIFILECRSRVTG